jgi:polysaccharide export outer membrane protein
VDDHAGFALVTDMNTRLSFLPPLLRRAGALAAVALLFAGAAAWGQDMGKPPAPAPSIPYKILHNDKIGIEVFGEPDLSKVDRVDDKGNISPILTGPVHVADLTLPEAQKVIEAAYRDGRYLLHPVVSLTPQELAPREVSVQGPGIKNPARYPLPLESSITLIDMISRAGSFTDVAAGNRVVVTRLAADGVPQVYTIDVISVLKGKEKDKEKIERAHMLLEPGDIIYVGEAVF